MMARYFKYPLNKIAATADELDVEILDNIEEKVAALIKYLEGQKKQTEGRDAERAVEGMIGHVRDAAFDTITDVKEWLIMNLEDAA